MARVVLYVRVDEGVHRWLSEVAKRSGMSLTATTEALLRAHRDQGVSSVELALTLALANSRGDGA